jgi:hypothetical protein
MLTEHYQSTVDTYVCRFDANPDMAEAFHAVELATKSNCERLILCIPTALWDGDRYIQDGLFSFIPCGEQVSDGVAYQRLRLVRENNRIVYTAAQPQTFADKSGRTEFGYDWDSKRTEFGFDWN